MKKLTATLLASTLLGIAAYAQGTVNFINIVGSLNAPDFMSDGTKISGASYTAELLAGTANNNLASVATTGFLTGAGAGYFSGGTVTLTGIGTGVNAFFQVRIFAASAGSFAAAQGNGLGNQWAQSSIFQVVTGGGGTPPSTPSPLAGLTSLTLNGVPEPSSLALAGLGAAALLVFRRRK